MKRPFRFSLNTVLNIALLFLVALILLIGSLMVRDKLLLNTQELGMSLTDSYATETELRLDQYLKALDMGSKYIDELYLADAAEEEIQVWLKGYNDKLADLFGGRIVDPYAVIDGAILAANPWEGDESYDYSSAAWYQNALAAEGETVFSDVYTDAITGNPVFTLSRRLAGEDNVLAMDVYISNKDVVALASSMPASYHFLIFDTNGNMLYSILPDEVEDGTMDAYLDELIAGSKDRSLFAYDISIRDPQGVNRGVYYAIMENGWYVIMTIPLRDVLMGDSSPIMYFLGTASTVLFLLLAFLIIRDFRTQKQMALDGGTIRILSDSFYAIYRVDFVAKTYTAIKISPDLTDIIPPHGEYATLLSTVKQLVRSETFQEFEQNFSISSIRQRVSEEIPDYGGDYKRKFGETYKWVNIRTIYEKNLAPHEVVLCFRDVDIEKKQRLQYTALLEDALSTAKQSTKAQVSFFSNMSHDMRTPLNAIIGFSTLAQKEPGDIDRQRDYLQKIEFSARQLLSLINDILEMSKMEAGQTSLDSKPFDLRGFIDETAAHFYMQAEQQSKQFSVHLDIHDDTVKGDSFKLGQVLNNLLSNSFKYSDVGSVIRLEVQQQDYQNRSRFQFTVSDSGIGMSQEFLEHIFEPYARETHFTAKSTMGTGLGMAIVKNLVQQMSGEIHVESQLGKGTTCFVTLPFEPAVKPAALTAEEEKSAGTVDLTGRRILVVEDNELNMEITAELLSMHGAEVLQAWNGQEALHIFTVAAPYSIDVILMDMQMPVMDGCEAARAIRALDKPDAASVPIIAVTANAFAEDMDKTQAAGMNGHIAKPIDFTLLQRTLADIFSN